MAVVVGSGGHDLAVAAQGHARTLSVCPVSRGRDLGDGRGRGCTKHADRMAGFTWPLIHTGVLINFKTALILLATPR
jgi:hypothetical protein